MIRALATALFLLSTATAAHCADSLVDRLMAGEGPIPDGVTTFGPPLVGEPEVSSEEVQRFWKSLIDAAKANPKLSSGLRISIPGRRTPIPLSDEELQTASDVRINKPLYCDSYCLTPGPVVVLICCEHDIDFIH